MQAGKLVDIAILAVTKAKNVYKVEYWFIY